MKTQLKGMEKTLSLLVLLVTLCGTAAAAPLVEGATGQDFQLSHYGNHTHFQGNTVDLNVTHKNQILPDRYHDDLVKWQVKTKTENGDLTELQVQYELDQSTGNTDLNGYKFDAKITFDGTTASQFKIQGNKINTTVFEHLEHLTFRYDVDGLNGTIQNTYSGPDTTVAPISSNQYRDDGREKLQVNIDNLHEPQQDYTMVACRPDQAAWNGYTTTATDPARVYGSWYDAVDDRVRTNGLDTQILLDQPDQSSCRYYNVTVAQDSTATFTVDMGTSVDGQWAVYAIGSIGGTTTSGSSELSFFDSFEDGDTDGWTSDSRITVTDNWASDGNKSAQYDVESGQYPYMSHPVSSFEHLNVSIKPHSSDYTTLNRLDVRVEDDADDDYLMVKFGSNNGHGIVTENNNNQIYSCSFSGSDYTVDDPYNVTAIGIGDDDGVIDRLTIRRGNEKCQTTNLNHFSFSGDTISTGAAGTGRGWTDNFKTYSDGPQVTDLNSDPANWSYDAAPSFNATVKPSGSSIDTVNWTLDRDSTEIDNGTMTNQSGVWTGTMPTLNDPGNYTLNVTAHDTNGYTAWITNTQELTQSGPTVSGWEQHRVVTDTGGLSYCSRNDVATSSGGTDLSFQVDAEDPGTDQYLWIRRVRNTNSMTVQVNNADVATLSSTTGSGCNSNNWVVERVRVPAAEWTGSGDTIEVQPSGTDENYVSLVASSPVTTRSLFSDQWQYLVGANVTDPQGDTITSITSVGSGYDVLQYGGVFDTDRYIEQGNVMDTSTTQDVEWNATDSVGLSNQDTTTLDVDYQDPVISSINLSDRDLVIDFNETLEELTGWVNVTDPEGHLDGSPSCTVAGTGRSVTDTTGTGYNCTATVSTVGYQNMTWAADDTVGHNTSLTTSFNVTKVDVATQDTSPMNYLELGVGPENTVNRSPVRFGLHQDITVNGTANDTARVYRDLEVTDLVNVTASGNLSTQLDNRTVRYNFSTNVTRNASTSTRDVDLTMWAQNMTYSWQNGGDTTRFYRVNATMQYNRSLQAELTVTGPGEYDPDNQHLALSMCSSPSSSERYSCSGNWDQVAATDNTGTEGLDLDNDSINEGMKYTTQFSDKLFKLEIQDGAEESTGSTGAGNPVSTQPTSAPSEDPQTSGLGQARQFFLEPIGFNVAGVEILVYHMFLLIIGGLLYVNRDQIGTNGGGSR